MYQLWALLSFVLFCLFYFSVSQHYSPNVRIHVKKITSPVLGREIIKRCGNEGQHPYLDWRGKTTLKFLRASISFIPEVIDIAGDLSNASFIFTQPGQEFVIMAGNGDWEFYFSQGYDNEIHGRCVRKPTLRYIWDKASSTIRRIGSFLLPIAGPELLALL